MAVIPADLIPLVVAACLFIVLLLIGISFYQFLQERTKRRAILDKVDPSYSIDLTQSVQAIPQKEKYKPIRNFFSKIGQHKDPEKIKGYSKLRVKFYRAGWYGLGVFPSFWGAKLSLGLLLPALYLLSNVITKFQLLPIYHMITVIILALIGFSLPNLWLWWQIRTRKERLFRGFPDAMDLLVICIEAGVGLDAAFSRVGNEIALTHPDLSNEMKIYSQELRIGRERKEAMRNLAARTNIQDVRSLVSLIIQTDRFGTSVADALKVYSDSFRTKRLQRAEEKAAKLPAKMIVVAMIFIFPVVYVVTLGPFILSAMRVLKTTFQ